MTGLRLFKYLKNIFHMNSDKKFIIRCRAIIIHEGKMLLVRHPHNKEYLALPGGHLEWGENAKECLKREIIEELGIEPVIGRLLYVHTYEDRIVTQPTEFFFEVKNGKDYLNIEANDRTHAFEIDEIVWANPNDELKLRPLVLANDFKAGKVLSDDVRFI